MTDMERSRIVELQHQGYLSNLRKKMASIGANVQIKATRGAGYLLEEII